MRFLKKLLGIPDVQLYESGINDLKSSLRNIEEKLHKPYIIQDIDRKPFQDFYLSSVLSSVYQKSVTRKDDIVSKHEQFRSNYLYSGILGLLIEDALAPSPVTNELVTLRSLKPEFDAELKKLQASIDIDSMISSIIEDLLGLGEYFLRVLVKKDEGVIALRDDVHQSKTVALYKDFLPEQFLTISDKGSVVSRVPAYEMIHYCYGTYKLRIEIDRKLSEQFVRTGRPVLYGNYDLLNNLTLLTVLVPATYVHKINASTVIGVSVPETMNPSDALEACRQYERLLNISYTEMFKAGETDIQRILDYIGRFKCVPLFSERGRLTRNDPRFEAEMDIRVIDDIRQSIMASIGVPYNFLFGGQGRKIDSLKGFARYVRKLSLIQRAIRDGLVQLSLIHLVSKGYSPTASDISVNFTNHLISVEDLDRLEYIDTIMSVLNNAVQSISSISNSIQSPVDLKELRNFLTVFLRMVDLDKLFSKETGVVLSSPKDNEQTQSDLQKEPVIKSVEPSAEPVTKPVTGHE